MSDLSAFIAGFIIGDTPAPIKTQKNRQRIKRNIAMQDICFCQCLANIMQDLEEFVRTNAPTPEEFIKYLLPKQDFNEPYTSEERKIIDANNFAIESYSKWIAELQNAGKLMDASGESSTWDKIDTVKKIWQDATHTPNMQHLDLLITNNALPSTAPVKLDGVLYEYNDTYFPLRGLAKGFFETIPSRIILGRCIAYSRQIIKKYGYDYDFTRFEYNARADRAGKLSEWRNDNRKLTYKMLLRDEAASFRIAWSDLTNEILSNISLAHKSFNKERELNIVYGILDEDDRQEIYNSRYRRDKGIKIFIVALCATLLVISGLTVLMCYLALHFSWGDGWLYAYTIPVVIATLFVGTAVISISSSYSGKQETVIKAALRNMQKSYYNGLTTQQAKKYAEFLARIS